MTTSSRGLFLCEGTSDGALAGIVTRLLLERGRHVQMTTPDFDRLPATVRRDLTSKLNASLTLMGGVQPDLVVMHRDSDNTEVADRIREMEQAVASSGLDAVLLPIVPVRMTEAWLLLDEAAIRRAAGSPTGRSSLGLPGRAEVERRSDPKTILRAALLEASGERGRRRDRVARRFTAQRRQLIDQLDVHGPVRSLPSWQALIDRVDTAVRALSARE